MSDLPIELNGVADALSCNKGFWRSCTGCHETNEGVPTGPYSHIMKCHLGGGCFECGGIGAVWDTTDYADMGRFIAEEATASEKLSAANQIVAELEEDRDRLREFLGKMQGVCMGVATSGRDHPNPDGALMELFNEAQAILFPPAPRTTTGQDYTKPAPAYNPSGELIDNSTGTSGCADE